MNLERSGSCRRCGECCAQTRCDHLRWDDMHTAICDIYDTRPEVCRGYPRYPEEIVSKGCGFSFKVRE